MARTALDRILGWIRAAYPDGVPAEDRAALLAVVENHLSGDQVAGIAALLGVAPNVAPSAEEVARVSGRLLLGGWPLANPELDDSHEDGVVARALTGVVTWLRSGYPEGVPDLDFIPLVAILERRLTKREVKAVTKELKANGLLSPNIADIEDAISDIIHETPSQEEIARVTAHLQRKGWPVELS